VLGVGHHDDTVDQESQRQGFGRADGGGGFEDLIGASAAQAVIPGAQGRILAVLIETRQS
jgi:hypothetical protein